jgi:hypothetical protein
MALEGHHAGYPAGSVADRGDRRKGRTLKLYRLLIGGDDAAFCKKVSEALNKGWALHGSASITFDTQGGRVVCGQAVVKEAGGEWTDAMLEDSFKLSRQ